jgi:hypothetical protein
VPLRSACVTAAGLGCAIGLRVPVIVSQVAALLLGHCTTGLRILEAIHYE